MQENTPLFADKVDKNDIIINGSEHIALYFDVLI